MNSGSFAQFAKIIAPLVESGETVKISPKGRSMLPTIKEGDKVTLSKPQNLSKYDIVLFFENEQKVVLHRIIDISKDGIYTMRGDSQSVKEKGITDENIVAKVISIEKNGKTVKTEGIFFYIRSFTVLHLKYCKRTIKRLLRLS